VSRSAFITETLTVTTKLDQRGENYELKNTYVSRTEVELNLNRIRLWNPNRAQALGERSKTVDFWKWEELVRLGQFRVLGFYWASPRPNWFGAALLKLGQKKIGLTSSIRYLVLSLCFKICSSIPNEPSIKVWMAKSKQALSKETIILVFNGRDLYIFKGFDIYKRI